VKRVWTILAFGFLGTAIAGCKRAERTSAETKAAPSAAGSAPVMAAASAPRPETPAPAPSGAGASDTPPASSSGGSKVDVENAVGLGCEAKTLDGWLELL
jgi:hypothetical protein